MVVNSTAYKILLKSAPYEANHVCCPGPFRLRCPNCGAEQPGFINPFLANLMELHPKETENWNSQHKGFSLCDPCDEYLKKTWRIIPGNDPDIPIYRKVEN